MVRLHAEEEHHPMRDLRCPALGPLALLALFAGACGEANGRLLGGELPGSEVPSWEDDIDDKRAAELRVGLCGDGVAQVELIDDMEDGDAKVLPIKGRLNAWFSFNDETLTGTQIPKMGTSFFRMSALDEARGKSKLAMRNYGSGFTDWGAGVGFDFLVQSPYDASAYAGVGFWARVTNAQPALAMRMNVNDSNTSPLGGVCDVDCQPASRVRTRHVEDSICDTNRGPCFDEFGVEIGSQLGTEWKFFKFPWSALKAVNWSGKNLAGVITKEVYGVRFQLAPSQTFDFWIDDVYFLCPVGK
jgi:hypothetical protein